MGFRSKQAFRGDIDASFQFFHGGYGRTSVGLWSVSQNQGVIWTVLDTDDTNYLLFASGPYSTDYSYSSTPYLNRWITLRIQTVGAQVKFYADSGGGSQLLQTWPRLNQSDSYNLVFGSGSVCWKSGPNNTSFRSISVTSASP